MNMSDQTIEHGARVIWSYQHHISSRSSITITKHGVYIARARYRPGGLYGPLHHHLSLALVKFDKNKGFSKVPRRELQLETDQS